MKYALLAICLGLAACTSFQHILQTPGCDPQTVKDCATNGGTNCHCVTRSDGTVVTEGTYKNGY